MGKAAISRREGFPAQHYLASMLALMACLAFAACGGGNGGNPGPGPGPGPGDETWHVLTLDGAGGAAGHSSGSVGQGASLAMIGGLPAISYSDDTNFGARFIRAANASGTAWDAPVQVASGSFAAADSTALAVVAGNPAIAFQRGNVKYVRSADTLGISWGGFVPVGSTNGRNSINLLVVDNAPVAVFRDPNIESVRASDAVGSAWPTTAVEIDGASRQVSAALVNGRLAVAYTTSTDQLAYRLASNAEGTAWGERVLVNLAQLTNFQPALAVVEGRPAISYVNNGDLLYIRADDPDGADWPLASIELDSGTGLNGQTDLTVIDGLPAVAYSRFPGLQRNLYYIEALDASGATWAAPQLVDNAASVGESLSLADVNGQAGIAYYDTSNANLKYAVLF